MFHGDTCLNKSSPLRYCEYFLTEYSPECKSQWVFLDQGGNIYNNPAINNIFKKFDYEILLTSSGASFQNGPVKQAHCTVSQEVKALLIGER